MVYIPPVTSQQGSTYDKGYAFTSDQTGDALALGAQAAGSATKTLVGLINAGKKKKLRKKAEKAQREHERMQFDAAIKDSLEAEADVLRTSEHGQYDIGSHFADRGIAESSDKEFSKKMHMFKRDQHLNALRQQRALMRHGYAAREKVRDIQKKLEKIEHQEAVIAASIDTAISVASIVCDRNAKVVVAEVDALEVLKGLTMLKISRFEYKPGQGPPGEHIGPMAQDFLETFGVGADPTKIEVVDAFGVALASIQAQAYMIERLERRIWRLEQERM